MSVAIIKKIGRKIFGSLMIFIVFISTVSVYITLHSTNNKKDTNGKDDEDIWQYKTDIKKEIPTGFTYIDDPNTYMYISVLSYFYIGLFLLVTCIVFCTLCRRDCIRGCLEISYNWLFRRNQARENEPAVHYRDDRIDWRGQQRTHPFEYASDEDELNSES